MKVTLDHNCIIDVLHGTPVGVCVLAAVQNHKYQCFVVNVGASEQVAGGGRSHEYSDFESLLRSAKLCHLPRLNPPWIWGLTFDDVSASPDESSDVLIRSVTDTLFPNPMDLFLGSQDLDSPSGLKVLNKMCDILTLWCHLKYGNDIFCTSDKNFLKLSRRHSLLTLGAKRVCTPAEL